MNHETASEIRALHLSQINKEIEGLHFWRRSRAQKEKWAALCEVAGGLFVLGSLAGLLASLMQGSCSDLRFYLTITLIGIGLFLYGWIWRRKHVQGVQSKIELCELARFLNRAELDSSLTVSTMISFGKLVVRIHDKKDSPEQRVWERTIGVDDWGVLFGH